MVFQVRYLVSFHFSKRKLQVGLDGMTSQEYLLNAGVPQCSIVVPTLFLLHINNLLDDIYSHAIYANETTLYSKCDQASVLWQQIVLGAELESDLQDTVDWCKKWLVDFAMSLKLSFVCYKDWYKLIDNYC